MLFRSPEVIILDEPTVGLDPKQITQIRELIKKLGEKHTIILSSHILSEISAVCDHVFIISKGKLVASDSTENLVNLMSGAQEIELTVKGESEKAQQLLQDIDKVDKVESREAVEAGTSAFLIVAEKNADVREEVFHQMAANGMPILQLQEVVKSLEDRKSVV